VSRSCHPRLPLHRRPQRCDRRRRLLVDPGLILGGIMVMQGVRKTYVLRKTDPSGTWVADGQDFMGWKIQMIDAAGVVLGNGERRIDLKLYPDR
jgi:hypothetical protein